MKLKTSSCDDQRQMTWDDTFPFRCHPTIDCFNSCCKDVTIFLTPLDSDKAKDGPWDNFHRVSGEIYASFDFPDYGPSDCGSQNERG